MKLPGGYTPSPLSSHGGSPATPCATPPSRECPFWVGQRVRLKDGGETNYWLTAPPTVSTADQRLGPLVVCIHGMNGSIATFENLIPSLVARGLHVLVYDLYGFGRSQQPRRSRLNLDTFVDQLLGLLSELGESAPVMLLGHSMGGVVAVEFARRHPDRVQKLLLTAPAGLMKRRDTPCRPFLFGCLRRAWGCMVMAILPMILRCCGGVIQQKIRKAGITPDVREPEKFKAYTYLATERMAQDHKVSIVSYLGVLRHMPLWLEDHRRAYEELASGTTPILFLWGDDDATIPWEEVRDSIREIFATSSPSGTSCIMIEGAGHGMNLEDHDTIANFASAWFLDVKDPNWINYLDTFKLSSTRHNPPAASTVGAQV